jgi:Uma2 family endonuclease
MVKIDALLEYGPVSVSPDTPMTDAQLEQLSRTYRPYQVELSSSNTLIIMSPVSTDFSDINAEILTELRIWSRKAGGKAYGPDGGFRLNDGSLLSPDVSWIRKERLNLSLKPKAGFRKICPDFVLELKSLTDKLSGGSVRDLIAKMQAYLVNGARLGWLIDPIEEKAYIFRPGKPMETVESFDDTLYGEDVLPGFELQLASLLELSKPN